MTKDQHTHNENGDETEDTTQEEMLDEQTEFGLNEEVREKIAEEDERTEPDEKAEEEDEVVDEEEVDDDN